MVVLLLLLYLFKCNLSMLLFKYGISVSTPNLILLEYFINDEYVNLLSINFSYRQANYIVKISKKNTSFILFKKRFN